VGRKVLRKRTKTASRARFSVGPELAERFGERTNRSQNENRRLIMKYGLAWLLGIPIPILAVVYLVSHC
jgi:hypothetical protein